MKTQQDMRTLHAFKPLGVAAETGSKIVGTILLWIVGILAVIFIVGFIAGVIVASEQSHSPGQHLRESERISLEHGFER